ncbi:MAG: diapophytoene dehydrogenase [Bacteroidetes bacterium CG18_big_fil_WC_8_21_14_2_50_41_14]|nr:MAG: diapophytoene dehydrogenase [Bacteroidetes bacterium CG18_big_fil_WC_8_21_14_2_50_41_14]
MAKFEIIMPKLGESIIEATITRWVKNVGESVEEDDSLVEIATDKVDSEIPSPVEGKLVKILFNEGDVVPVGTVIAWIEMDGEEGEKPADEDVKTDDVAKPEKESPLEEQKQESTETTITDQENNADFSKSERFYSPLVKSMAKTENISLSELEKITGSGRDNRVTKSDVVAYLDQQKAGGTQIQASAPAKPASVAKSAPVVPSGEGDQVVEMDRMRKLIADHMVMSKQVSPHVTSFIDADVTHIVNWRNRVKDNFSKREGEKITFTPIFIHAAAQALREFPQINVSLDGYHIIYRKNINIGMATALPSGNLIVPVIRNADQKNLLGIVKTVNNLANRARINKLLPDEIQGGTFTITNFGSFDSLTGTPIINQPQVAILGLGAIRKQPRVIETPEGDLIGIRHIMILSLAYDHRIVDGALGGKYLKRMKELLEGFDPETQI